ncbi:MAG TPA: hypothetical protein VMS60_08945 [Solirubrobacterales bacterium]|nr:hypothetical protein [Solirubrobacterales bacterium]
MKRNVRAGSRRNPLIAAILGAIAALALLAPAGATGATVVNGSFETGTLAGWQVVNSSESGNWFAYSGTTPPIGEGPVPAPPVGVFAAISAQDGPGTHVLYQDVALEPGFKHQLSMFVYYKSAANLVTPSPNTLSSGFPPPNQQYRVDVMKPTAPLESVAPGDILATVFATQTGGPLEMAPTVLTTDLTPFAGQTVRLRLVEVDNQLFLWGGADGIAIQSTPPPPSNVAVVGKAVLNKKNGTAKLPVTLPGAGVLSAVDANFVTVAGISAKKKKRMVKSATVTATAPGILNVPLKPTGPGRKVLNEKGKLKIRVALTFTPTGGTAATQTVKVTLKKKLKPKPKKG